MAIPTCATLESTRARSSRCRDDSRACKEQSLTDLGGYVIGFADDVVVAWVRKLADQGRAPSSIHGAFGLLKRRVKDVCALALAFVQRVGLLWRSWEFGTALCG